VADAGYTYYGPFAASSNDVLVFSQSAASTQQLTWYGRDGKRFLIAQGPKRGPEQFTVVLNWQSGLKK